MRGRPVAGVVASEQRMLNRRERKTLDETIPEPERLPGKIS
jgi:hypothetical protein